jgi:hypothetical protein
MDVQDGVVRNPRVTGPVLGKASGQTEGSETESKRCSWRNRQEPDVLELVEQCKEYGFYSKCYGRLLRQR